MTFKPGGKGGPGRPKRSVEEEYLRIGTDAVPPGNVRAILAKLVERATAGDGDVRAAQAVLRFLYGDDPVLTRKLLKESEELKAEVRRLAGGHHGEHGGGGHGDNGEGGRLQLS
jgi:hypothetical protein